MVVVLGRIMAGRGGIVQTLSLFCDVIALVGVAGVGEGAAHCGA